MQTCAPLTVPRCAQTRLSVKPYCGRYRPRRAQTRAPVRASAVPVNPLLPLWQQPAVQQAALKAVVAAGASFIAASALSTLVGKVARKVRKHALVFLTTIYVPLMLLKVVCLEQLALPDVWCLATGIRTASVRRQCWHGQRQECPFPDAGDHHCRSAGTWVPGTAQVPQA